MSLKRQPNDDRKLGYLGMMALTRESTYNENTGIMGQPVVLQYVKFYEQNLNASPTHE
jgi:hypothetical protein